MFVLGIETATTTCAVALAESGQLRAEVRYKLKNKHAEIIADMIREIMQRTAIDFSQLDGIAVSRGPGSFTGLRIGLAMAKGLAFAHNLPVVGIHTPDAIASSITPIADRLIVVLPSRKDEIYAAPYRNLDGFYHREGKIVALAINDFAKWAGERNYVAGPGIKTLTTAGIGDHIYLKEIFWEISAAAVARLGARKIIADEIDDLATLEPEYIKTFRTTMSRPSLPTGA